jgi:hypothetical protein
MNIIVKLLLAGVSRANIIAKYGKKAYDAAKKTFDKLDKAAAKSKILKKANEPIFKKKLKKDIDLKGKKTKKGYPESTPVNENRVTFRMWKDGIKRDFLETTPADVATIIVTPPAVMGASIGLSKALRKRGLGAEKDKKNKGGKIKTYAKGGGVRKPKY